MRIEPKYSLCRGVQVRPEKFGLLFYHYAGPKLYFVPTGDLVDESFFAGEQTFEQLLRTVQDRRRWSEETAEKHLSELFRLLKSKELVHEQPVY